MSLSISIYLDPPVAEAPTAPPLTVGVGAPEAAAVFVVAAAAFGAVSNGADQI